jgi:hypothetical protein
MGWAMARRKAAFDRGLGPVVDQDAPTRRVKRTHKLMEVPEVQQNIADGINMDKSIG